MIQPGQFVTQIFLCPTCGVACRSLSTTQRSVISITCVNPACEDTGATMLVDRQDGVVLYANTVYMNGERVYPAMYDANGNQVWPAVGK